MLVHLSLAGDVSSVKSVSNASMLTQRHDAYTHTHTHTQSLIDPTHWLPISHSRSYQLADLAVPALLEHENELGTAVAPSAVPMKRSKSKGKSTPRSFTDILELFNQTMKVFNDNFLDPVISEHVCAPLFLERNGPNRPCPFARLIPTRGLPTSHKNRMASSGPALSCAHIHT